VTEPTTRRGFRAACREQAGLAWSLFARFWGRYAPKGRGRIALRAGCLLFAPFITLFAWMVQGMIWVAISTPILAYALLMAAVGGGFSRDRLPLGSSPLAPPPLVPPPPPPPSPAR
jgi:hypothetical protein